MWARRPFYVCQQPATFPPCAAPTLAMLWQEHTPSGHRTRHKIIKQDTGDSVNNSWKSAADWLDDLQCNRLWLQADLHLQPLGGREEKDNTKWNNKRNYCKYGTKRETVSLTETWRCKKPKSFFRALDNQEQPHADSQVSTVFTSDHLFPPLLIYTLLKQCISKF